MYDLAVTGNRICTAALLFIGFNIFASGMFTALSNGVVSAVLAFSRSFVFMVAAMLTPYRSIVKVATPVVTNLWKERDTEGLRHISRQASLAGLVVGCYLFLVIWVNLGNIFSLMPAAYASGRWVFLFLGLGRIVDMYSGLNGTVLVTSKKYRYDFLFSLLLVGLTVATNALLIPRYGMNGAALATMTTVVVYNLVRVVSVRRFFGIQPFAWRDLGVVGLSVALIGLFSLWPRTGGLFVDAALRTAAVSALFGGAVYASNLSPELNGIVDRALSRLGIRIRK